MALMKKCDRCGSEVAFDSKVMEDWRYIKINDDLTFDLCPQCYKHFREFMNGRLFDHEERKN